MPQITNLFKRKRKNTSSSTSSASTTSSSANTSDPNYEDPVAAAAEEVYDDEPEMAQAQETVDPIFFRNMDHGRLMEYFKNKKYENTKTLVRQALETMGVHDQFFGFTTSLGIESRFWDLKEKSYNRLTAEFLSTLKLRREGDLVAIDFQLLDKQFSATELEIAEWFGFLPGGQEEVDYPVTIWKVISDTDPPANKDSPRAKYIQHPVLRVIQRALAQTIFGRGESAIQVRLEELGLFRRIVQPSIPRANLVVWMINYWASIASNRRKGNGQIQIGQFITKIAKEKGLRLADLEETNGYDKMDISFWEKT